MSDSRRVVSGTPDSATLELPRAVSAAWKPGTPLDVHSFGPDGALLVRASSSSTGFFAASLSSLSVEEAFAFAMAGVRTGRLSFVRGAVKKTVSFRDGQVVFATSSESWERLGTVLVSLRLLTREELTHALSEVGPAAKLGQVLTRSGKLTQAKLYSAMTQLTRDIVLNLLSEEGEGQLLFLEGIPPGEDALKLPQSTRELVLSGVKRRDEVFRLRRKHPDTMRVRRGRDPGPGPGRAMLERVGEGCELLSLRAAFEGTGYAFYKRIEELLSAGALVEEGDGAKAGAANASAPSQPLSALERYASLVRAVCDALKGGGHGLEDLRSFLADPLPGMEDGFSGVMLSDDGNLDTARLVKNLGGDSPLARARTFELMDAFVSYALFSARNVLPADTAEKLSARARQIREGAS